MPNVSRAKNLTLAQKSPFKRKPSKSKTRRKPFQKTLRRHRAKLVKPHHREDHRTPVPTHHSAPHRREDREAHIVVSVQPFILKSQLYSSVKDRTQVDRELESLRRDKVLRIFKLNTGQDDYAIMFLDDYIKQIKDWFALVVTPTRELAFQLAEQFRLTEIISNSKQPSEWHPKSHW
ncbi:Serine/threonine-protein kinase [Arachis hypogaea]|nr:Serine/threonine-protein kinase [Arachis hypogaea]